MNQHLRIGITDCSKYDNYRRWMETEAGVEPVKLSVNLQNVAEVDLCDGILFSGGEDLHPGLYGKPEYVEKYGLKDIIPERDQFEYKVIERAISGKKPILGICRGLQLINVYLGGTLVPDIPTLFQSGIHGKKNGLDQIHHIRVEPGSMLQKICGQEEGMVNSAHHQSVDRPAEPLKIVAFGEPGIAEALEWKDPETKSWMLMVQWHPERMTDLSSPFSELLKKAFLKAAGMGSKP
jgi:putative glutamine amidotransferase